jgi:hypothetical protein
MIETGLTETLLELPRSLSLVRSKLRRMDGLRSVTPASRHCSSHKRH